MIAAVASPDDDAHTYVTIRMTLRIPRPVWHAMLSVAARRRCTRLEALHTAIEDSILCLTSKSGDSPEQNGLPGDVRDLLCLPVLPRTLLTGGHSS
jgi:hypothetical protein